MGGHLQYRARRACIECCPLPQVRIDDFIADRSWWSAPCVLTVGHYNRFTDRHPEAYSRISDELRAKFYRGRPRERSQSEITICAHVRRGDVSASNPRTAHRTASSGGFINCLTQVQAALAETGTKARTKVFSQGDERGLEMLQAIGCELHLDTPAIDSFQQLVDADVLIMGRSSFSFTAALLCDGLCIYDPFARAPVPGWLVRNSEGLVNGDALAQGVRLALETK